MVFGACSQHCNNVKGSYRCACEKNYKEWNNSCKAKGKVTEMDNTKSFVVNMVGNTDSLHI